MKVLLIAPVPPPYGGMALQARQLERLMRRDGVEVTFLASNFTLPVIFRPLDRLPGIRTMLRAVLVWFELWVRVGRVEIVHVLAASWLYFFVVVYPAVLVGRARGKRVVVNYHGGAAEDFFRHYGRLSAPVFRLADAVTAPSKFISSVIRQRFGVPVLVVPNVLDTAAFTYRRRAVLRPTLLVTRHLEKIYDIESVLRAFGVVQAAHPAASLWVAGSGSEEANLRAAVASWNLRNVRFLGEIAHDALPAIYDQCDIYVNASLVDNAPGALLEASAAGLVVVTTRAGGIPYIYEHGRTAWLVNTGDWRGLAAGIEFVLEHPSITLELTDAALAVARGYEWSEVRKHLCKAYGVGAKSFAAENLGGAGCAAG